MPVTGPIPVRRLTSTSIRRYVNIRATACGEAQRFNLKRKPWIIPDEVDVATVIKVIDTCPSGALKYRQK